MNSFNYLTFDLEIDKACNSLSRVALFRKHIVELDIDYYIFNENICFEFCKQVRSVKDESEGTISKRK